MVLLPKNLRIWLVASNVTARARLREAINNIIVKPAIRVMNDSRLLQEPPSNTDSPSLTIITESSGPEEITRIAQMIKSTPGMEHSRVIVALDKRGNIKSSPIVSLYLSGIDGFISEPYSINDMQLLFTNLLEGKDCLDKTDKTYNSSVFVLADAMQYINQAALTLNIGEKVSNQTKKEFERISETLNKLNDRNSEEYIKAITRSYADTAPLKLTTAQLAMKERKKVGQILPHPGLEILKLSKSRNIQMAELSRIMHMPEEDLKLLFEEKLSINSSMADGLARGLGRSPRDWLAMQKAYDKQQKELEKKGMGAAK